MNIINSTPRRAQKCISLTERAMELEQKPDSYLYPDEHATLYLDHTIAHIKIDNSHVSSLLKDIIMMSANNNT